MVCMVSCRSPSIDVELTVEYDETDEDHRLFLMVAATDRLI